TQDQIAAEMGISRQRAQRLVARAVSDGLIRVRLEHPISACLDLERQLRNRFGLTQARVAPGLGQGVDPVRAIAPIAAAELERIFAEPAPLIIALGTGRTLRAAVDEMQIMDCARHKVVSLIGNVAPDGSASFFEVIMRIADKTNTPHYPMAVPVVAKDEADRAHYHALPHVQNTRELASRADYTIVGVGQLGPDAPLLKDGFVSATEMSALGANGGIGELAGWAFDSDGRYLESGINRVVCGVQVPQNANPVLCIGAGFSKRAPLLAALKGKLISGLITDEPTAIWLLDQD
ncbi:MAG: sugar-binding domain-containing protein, partial [Deltaproteobacteria bacterium]